MVWSPSFECHVRPDGEHEYRIGHPLVDQFLEFVVGRARPNTVRAYAHDLSVFFTVVRKEPTTVRPKDVMSFVTAQRRARPGAENVVRIADGSAGLSAATIKRRLAAVSCLYGYLITRDDVDVTTNPVPRGIATRKSRSRGGRGLPLVRGVRRLPRVLDADEVESLMGALRTERDRAMTQAMVLGGSGAVRFSACVWAIFDWASAGCSSPRARAGTSDWCRSRRRSLPRWRVTWTTSDRSRR